MFLAVDAPKMPSVHGCSRSSRNVSRNAPSWPVGTPHHGVAVIEGSRLEALALPGEILATDLARVLGQRRAAVRFEGIGERTLKGLDDPVLVHRVVDVTVGAIPALPRALATEQRLPLIGRERDVEQFRTIWNASRTGAGGLLLVRGQPGIGKTRLVSYCAAVGLQRRCNRARRLVWQRRRYPV